MTDKPIINNGPASNLDLAAWLKLARENAGLSEATLCQITKIHPKYVRALESGDWGVLPSKTHLRAFSLAFAKACGADAGKTIELVSLVLGRTAPAETTPQDYIKRTGPTPARRTEPDPYRPVRSPRPTAKGGWGLVLAMGAGVALVLWVLMQLTAPTKKQILQTVISSEVESQNEIAPTAVPTPPKAKKEKKEPPKGEAVPALQDAEKLAPLEVDRDALADQALTLRSNKECWLVVELDGKRLPVVILGADEKKVWYFRQRLVLLAGNAGAVKAWWQGNSVGLLGKDGERVNGLVFEKDKPMTRLESAFLELPAGIQPADPGSK